MPEEKQPFCYRPVADVSLPAYRCGYDGQNDQNTALWPVGNDVRFGLSERSSYVARHVYGRCYKV